MTYAAINEGVFFNSACLNDKQHTTRSMRNRGLPQAQHRITSHTTVISNKPKKKDASLDVVFRITNLLYEKENCDCRKSNCYFQNIN